MPYSFKKYLILFLILIPAVVSAQNKFRISGKVVNKANEESIPYVALQLTELERWTISNENGEFIFENVPAGNYTLEATCLAFEKFEMQLDLKGNQTGIILNMVEFSLGLEEITVVAKENTSLSSSSKIENTAIEHIQPTNLSDVMQLVPGQITLNPDMSNSNQITIRDINKYADRNSISQPNDNDALGTAIIVDGTPIDNDANMQTLNTAGGGTAQGYSTAGQGIDLRQISTDNIESVEVIRGIPSVEYGDLTTGAVLVKTKAGKTPLNAKVKVDPLIKQFAVSKGLLLPGDKNGAFNIDLDYTHSYDDLRKPSRSFKRVTAQSGYSNTLFKDTKPLSINFKANFFSTFDNEKNDPDQLKIEIYKEKEQGLDLKLFGKWSVQKSWLNNISYNFSGSFKKQDYYEYKLTANNSAAPLPIALVSGESEGVLLPSQYFSELTIDGKPYNFFGTVKAQTKWNLGKIKNDLLYGADWRTSGNNGDGRIYDQTRPPSGALSTRPRAFKDIPASHKLALFVENEFIVPIGKTVLTTSAGIRYNNLLPKGLLSTKDKGYITLEPRINSVYEILKYDKNKLIRNLSLRFGYGKTSKTPTMIHLYPDKSYEDELSFNYYPDLIVITTQVIDDTSNPDLKPMTNDKWEIGADFNIKGVKFIFTAFKENIKNGFNWLPQYYGMVYRKWDQLEGEGKNPYFEDGNIFYTENNQTLTVPFNNYRDFHSYRSPENSYAVNKKGLEYVIDFGEIKSIRTDFRIDGAYYYINRIGSVKPFTEKKNISYLGSKFPYLTLFPGNDGDTDERLNSNFKTITHIPELKMVFTLSTQLIWIDKGRNYWEDENGNPLAYSLGENNKKLYGDFEGVDKIFIDPVGFYDMDMNFHEWQDNYSFENPYAFMVKEVDSDYFDYDTYPVLWQLNLKLTKEFGNKAKLSFFANNMFNHRPLHKNKRTGYYSRRNQTAYFGAELKFSL
ncbi:MAG: TonB-dependent receptor [Prolixibacteraceae bacterium]|nr:TonB-dependent receptor [Prolixibacteraceae bacterium]